MFHYSPLFPIFQINSKSKTKNEDNHGKTSKNTPSTPANPHSTVRHRNDSVSTLFVLEIKCNNRV